jgi:dethiobiotin synthetase
MGKGLFIIGTDTGVGKTVVAAAIARALSTMGSDVGIMKPIETGCHKRNGRLILSDALYLKTAARVNDPLDMITPYAYHAPLAPRAASLLEKKEIDLKAIRLAYDQLSNRHAFLIIEGVGGLVVPLSAQADVSHLIRLFELPVLLVARSGLGTLNHTLLTLRYGTSLGIRFLGILFNRTTPFRSLADKTNPYILAEQTDVPLLGTLPYFRKSGNRERDIDRTMRLLMGNESLRKSVLSWIGNDRT